MLVATGVVAFLPLHRDGHGLVIDDSLFTRELIRTGELTAVAVLCSIGARMLRERGCYRVQSKKTKKRDKKNAKAVASFHMAQAVAPGQCHTVPKRAESEAEAEGSEEEDAEDAQEVDELLFPWLRTQQAEEEEEGSGDEDAMLAAMLGRQRAARRRAQSEEEEEQESEGSADEADADDDDAMLAAMMGRHQRGRTAAAEETPSEHSEDEAAVHQVSSGELEEPVETLVCAEAASEEGRSAGKGAKAADSDERDEKSGKRGGKAKEKRAKRAAQSIQKELSAAAEACADDPFACKVRYAHSVCADFAQIL